MAYDARNKDVVMFGGIGRSDTWTWDGSVWTQRHPGTWPQRTVGVMLYDDALGEVLFVDEQITVWAWNGKDWSRVGADGAPPALAYTGSQGTHVSAGYDPQLGGLVVLANDWSTQPAQSTYVTWSWNGSNWTKLGQESTALNRGPDSANGELVFDPQAARFVSVGNGSSGATWTWNPAHWVEAPQPFGSGGPAVYSPQLGGIVTVTACTGPLACGDGQTVWLDRSGVWTKIGADSQDKPVDVEAMTSDPDRGLLVVLGCATLVCAPA